MTRRRAKHFPSFSTNLGPMKNVVLLFDSKLFKFSVPNYAIGDHTKVQNGITACKALFFCPDFPRPRPSQVRREVCARGASLWVNRSRCDPRAQRLSGAAPVARSPRSPGRTRPSQVPFKSRRPAREPVRRPITRARARNPERLRPQAPGRAGANRSERSAETDPSAEVSRRRPGARLVEGERRFGRERRAAAGRCSSAGTMSTEQRRGAPDPETRECAAGPEQEEGHVHGLGAHLVALLRRHPRAGPAKIVSIYPLLSPPSLTNHASNRVCNALHLLQCADQVPAPTAFFLPRTSPCSCTLPEHGEQNEAVRLPPAHVPGRHRRAGQG